MRFLCLAGMGTNARILELQLSAIISNLSGHHDFIYINGEVESDPGQGLEHFFGGPFYSFWDVPTSNQLKAAIELIEDAIDEDGPFDVILGYSQGAGMAATYLIQDARAAHPQHHFKGAVFINANMPFDPDSRTFTATAERFLWCDTQQAVDFNISQEYPEVNDPHYGCLQALNSDSEICQRFRPSAHPLITIPTVHIVGDADELYRPQGRRLQRLCDPKYCELVEYRGSHSIPKDIVNTSRITRAIESLLHETVIG